MCCGFILYNEIQKKEKEDGQRNVIVCLVRSRDNIIKATTASSTRTKKKFIISSKFQCKKEEKVRQRKGEESILS